MSLTTAGRLTVAEAEATSPEELTPDNSPLYAVTVTVTTPATGTEHAKQLATLALESPFVQIGVGMDYVEVEIGTPEVVTSKLIEA